MAIVASNWKGSRTPSKAMLHFSLASSGSLHRWFSCKILTTVSLCY